MADGLDQVNAELYRALMIGDEYHVMALCRSIPEGPLHILNRNKDTVLHMAAQSKQKELALMLLTLLGQESHRDKMTLRNEFGNTILHEAATSNKQVKFAAIMLNLEPRLLNMRNRRGETPLFRAVLYGNLEMFKFLANLTDMFESEGIEDAHDEGFLIKDDKTTILHASILTEHFELALHIAKRYEHLINEPNRDLMIPLELLARNPSAFENGSKLLYSV